MIEIKSAKTKRLTWDETFMNLAIIASKRTACKFHETGSVVVDKNQRVISFGYNGPTAGDLRCIDSKVGCAKVDGDPVTGKLKRCRGAHGEVNAIINAQDSRRLKGATIYTVLFPCYDCMKALNNAGITEIVYMEKYERIKEGGKETETEDESMELANMRKMIVRKYEGAVYCSFPAEYNTKVSEHTTSCDRC